VITPHNLEKYVGKPRFLSDRLYEKESPPGVVCGLAWTAMGGSTLYIESVIEKSAKDKGGIHVTGHLGEVMKESTEIATTVSRRILKWLQPESDFFDSNTIHIHCPSGAVPKDG
jgi:Lon-like ATP-dependent protease